MRPCGVLKKVDTIEIIMRKNKRMTDDQRLSLLKSYLSSGQSKNRFSKENGISRDSLSLWFTKFGLENTLEENMRPSCKTSCGDVTLAEENARLRQALRERDIELKRSNMLRDAYSLMIDLAEEKYGVQVRKNSNAK